MPGNAGVKNENLKPKENHGHYNKHVNAYGKKHFFGRFYQTYNHNAEYKRRGREDHNRGNVDSSGVE
jgi:hypothetical protein